LRPLRDTYESGRMPKDPPPSEPVAVLATVVRTSPTHDATSEGDRAFFGLDEAQMRALGPRVTPLCELSYELLERASVWFERLGGLRVGVVHAGPAGLDLGAVSRVLGLAGPIMSTTDGPHLFSAIHLAAQMIRADEADLVLALAEDRGDLGVCLGRADRAASEDWRMEGLLSGIAAGYGNVVSVASLAATRAGFPHLGIQGGAAELPSALAEVAQGTGSVLLSEASGDRCVALVLSPSEPQSQADGSPRFLGLSARSGRALDQLVAETAAQLGDSVDFAAFAMDAARRPAFEHRLAVPLGPVDEARQRLLGWGSGARDRTPAGFADPAQVGGVVFVFPPAGAQAARVGERLYETEPTFRDALNRCDRIARPHLPRALLSVLFPAAGRESEIDDPGYANPVTFATGWALSELLRSHGVEPKVVLGCGVGELVAAAVAGTLDVEQAMRLAVDRGRLLRGLADPGRRAVLGASEEQVRGMLAGEEGVDLVAVPRPGRTIVGGRSDAVARFVDRARLRGIKAAEVDGTPAHSPLVDSVLSEYAEAAAILEYRPGDLHVVSSVTGRLLTTADAGHWVGTLRAPLRFATAVETAWELGGRTFLELGPSPTMASAGEQTLAGRAGRFLPALVPGTDDRQHLAEVLCHLWCRGARVNVGSVSRVPSLGVLPTYRFDHRPLAGAWEDDRTEDTGTAAKQWHAELPEEEAEITLVPPEEQLSSRTDELLDLGKAPGPEPLRPLFLPPADDDDGMSVDSDPISDITLDDLRYQGPGRPHRPGVPLVDEWAGSGSDFLGQQGPVWRESWVEAPLPEVLLEPTTFVVLTNSGVGDSVCAIAQGAGHRVIRVELGTEAPRDRETFFVPDPTAEDAWMEVLDAVGTLHGTVQLVHLWTAGEEDVPDVAGWPSVVALVREVVAEGLPAAVHLVTSGVIGAGGELRDIAAGMWGVAGLVGSETDLFAGIVDIDRDEPDPHALYEHLLSQAAEGSLVGSFVLRDGRRSRKVIAPVAEPPRPEGIDASGTWVLGGDVDHLMLDLGSWLVTRGVKRLFLIGATAPPAEVLKSALDLQKRGTACIVVRADAADPKGADSIRQRLSRETKLSGAFLRFQPTPSPLREIDVAAGLHRWRASLAGATVLMDLVGAEAPVYAWSEARALDGAPGNGVGACLATALAARLTTRAATGAPSAIVHSGPHTTLPPGESVRLVTGLCALGGQWGVWLP
jgi:malonyl CoA-acyl carrier protein transacylase